MRIVFAEIVVALGLFSLYSPQSLADQRLESASAYRPGEGLLVGFKSAKTTAEASAALSAFGLRAGTNFSASADVIVLHVVSQGDRPISAALIESLKQYPDIAFVERNHIVTLDAAPNDTNFGMQWALNNMGAGGGIAGADVRAVGFWDIITDSSTVPVAIVDSGINYSHGDLATNIATNAGETGNDPNGQNRSVNAVDDDNNGLVDDFRGWDFISGDNDPLDENGHGTAVAGIIGAVGNNNMGIAGVAWRAKMINIRSFDTSGSGDVATVVAGINYAVAQGAKVINCSWGVDTASAALRTAVDAALAAGAVIVTSAGNAARNLDTTPRYPASYRLTGVFVVGSSDSSDRISSFSNYGLQTIDIFAPGSFIYTTSIEGGYTYVSGTSFAAAHLTGGLSLMLARESTLTAAQLLQRIMFGVDLTAAMTLRSKNGGRLNLVDSNDANDTTAPAAGQIVSVTPASATSFRMVINAPTDDNNAGIGKRVEIRTAASPITTQAEWDQATPIEAAIVQRLQNAWTVDGVKVARNASGFVAFRAVDNFGNVGPVSTNSMGYTIKATQFISYNADATTGWTATGTWGTETSGGRTYFTESPNANYGNNLSTTLTLATPITFTLGPPYVLSYDIEYNTESGLDLCRLEVSTDGTNYTTVRSLSGTSPFIREAVDITASVPANKQIRFRLRFTSNATNVSDGCRFDNLEFRSEEN